MATAIQRRRGTTTQHSTFTGLAGEITIDTTLNTVIVHDGSTQGGIRLAKYSEVQAASEGDITAVAAGNGLSGGGTGGAVTLNIDPAYFDKTASGTGFAANFEPSANNTYSLGALTNVWKDVFIGPGSLYVNGQQVISDNSGTIQIAADTNQNISTVTSGTGDIEFTAGGTIQFKSNVVLSSGKVISTEGGAATKFTSNVNMNSNNINNVDDPVAAQDAATKAYVDAQVQTKDALSELSGDTDDVTEGSTNLYHTTARARTAIGVTDAGGDGSMSYNTSTGVITYTGPSAAEVRAHISVTDAGGDGSLSYSDGVITYTGPSATEVRAHLSGGTGVTYSGGQISIGQAVGTGDNVTFNQVTADVVGDVTGTVSSVSNHDTDDISEGASNLYYTDARARGAVSVTDSGGDGSLSYNSSTGVITYTGPSASEVRAHISGGTGVTVSSGEISIGQAVSTTSDVTFADVVVSGNLTVSGTQTIINTTTASLADNIIELNRDASGAPSENAGLQVNRGSSSDVFFQFNEGTDRWQFTNDGSTYFNLPTSTADITENTNLYYTDTRARAAVSVTDSGGDGSLAYNSSTGVITYTGPSASEVRAHFSAGTGISISSGEISTSITQYEDSDARSAISATGDLSYNSTTGVMSFSQRTDSEVRALLSGGTGITYDNSTGAISLTDTGYVTGVTAGVGLSGGGTSGTVSLAFDGSELTDMTDAVDGSEDELILLDNGSDRRKLISEINLGQFNNDQGWTSNVGDITGVTAGSGLTGGGSSGGVTLNIGAGTGITVNADDIALSTSGVTAATYGDADSVAQVAVDAYGRVTSASSVDISIAASQVSSGTLASARLPDLTVADFAGAAIQTGSESFSDSDTALMTAAAVNDRIQAFGYTTNVGDITGVTAGTGLSGGGSSGSVTLNVSGLTVAEFAGGSIQTGAEAFSDSDTVLMTAAAVQDKILSYGYSTTTGDITGVTAGTNLNGGGSSGGVTLNLDTALTGMASASFSGTVTANLFDGTATSARYADLAEKYKADDNYEPGTVVCFGGEHEVTACEKDACHSVAGVISTDPAYMMNSDAEGLYVALCGRVPCKVVGPVNKGDLLVSSEVKGHAKADNDAAPGRIIGKAIGSSDSGEAIIEVLVNLM